jgi:hypothetical protein
MTNGVFWDVTPCGTVLQEAHCVTSQKTPFFIVTAVKTSNLTNLFLFGLFKFHDRNFIYVSHLRMLPTGSASLIISEESYVSRMES